MAETWLLNESIDAPNNEHTWNANFISNGIAYTKLTWSDAPRQVLKYDSTVVYKEAPLHSWLDQAYRTISFDAAPTSDLLTFLQTNGVKQINPANKVVVNGETILDLTQDSVTPSSLLKGITAHDKSGAQITGTMEASAGGDYNIAATTNADGTQNLAITDAAGGGSGSGGRPPVSLTITVDPTRAPEEWSLDVYGPSGSLFTFDANNPTFTIPDCTAGDMFVVVNNSMKQSTISGYFDKDYTECVNCYFDITGFAPDYVGSISALCLYACQIDADLSAGAEATMTLKFNYPRR